MSKLIEITLTKCKLFLTESELQQLLATNPVLWARAIMRGKGIKRYRAAKNREAKVK